MDVRENAKVLWDYLKLSHDPGKSDCILVFGSHDTLVAERAAELFADGKADRVIVTGGYGRFTKKLWNVTEAEKFSGIMISRGVPERGILLETKASNTGENISFSRKLIEGSGCEEPRRVIAVCQPFRERRVYASLKKQWPGPEFMIASPRLTFDEYRAIYEDQKQILPVRFFGLLTGEFRRITEYGDRGYMIPQSVPREAVESFRILVSEGFNDEGIG